MRRTACGLAALACLLAACSGPTMPAFGDSDDLVIVMEPGAGEALRAAVADVFEATDPWLVGEPVFEAEYAAPADLADYTTRRNLLLCGTWSDAGVAGIVRDRVPGVPVSDEPGMAVATDIWAGRQVVAALMAGSEDQLVAYLAEQDGELADRLVDAVRKRLVTALDRDAETSGLHDALEQRFGWTISVPEDYELDTGAEDDGFVRFDRRKPDRYIFVTWRPGLPEDVTLEFALEERTRLCAAYHNGDVVQEGRPVRSDTVRIDGHPALRIRGWWGNSDYTAGGPFVAYCFAVPEERRVYYLDANLFAPGLDKTPLMRHLDAVLRSFRP